MIKLINPGKAEGIVERYDAWIGQVAERYQVPAALIKSILYQEMTQIDLMDPVADIAVQIAPRYSRDSSTGYAQVFGRVGLVAVNFAVDRGLATYESLGISCDHRLDEASRRDVRKVWRKLHEDPKANIEIAALNLLVIADELVGRLDFDTFSDDEIKLVLSRYNANTNQVTSYGEQAFQHYKRYSESGR